MAAANPNEPIDDPIEVVARQVAILLRRGLPDQAIVAIRQYACEAAEDRHRRDTTPIDEWSIIDEDMGLKTRLRAILADTAYTTIGRCDAASDDELLKIEMLGHCCLKDLREAIAKVLARHGDRAE